MITNIEGFKQYKQSKAILKCRDLRIYYVQGRLYLMTGNKPQIITSNQAKSLIESRTLFN
jgi:hypothetical protein